MHRSRYQIADNFTSDIRLLTGMTSFSHDKQCSYILASHTSSNPFSCIKPSGMALGSQTAYLKPRYRNMMKEFDSTLHPENFSSISDTPLAHICCVLLHASNYVSRLHKHSIPLFTFIPSLKFPIATAYHT